MPNIRPSLVRRLLRHHRTYAAAFVAAVTFAAVPVVGQTAASGVVVPSYNHVFLIMEENNGFSDVIGNAAAPNLNYYAKHFGTATAYYGVNGTSEPNYVGILGGSTFGLNSDDAYWKNAVTGPSLISELDQAGISWKAYLQGLPHPGYEDICFPSRCNGAPDSDPLYVSKHDGIQNFSTSQNSYDWSHQVPIEQLSTDLASGNVPRFSYIVPDECHDMHGDPPYCLDSGNEGDPENQHLIAVGDEYLGGLVSAITNAPFWAQGNNAIAITYDSGDNAEGCCDARPGGGQVPAIVITSHGPRGIQYSTKSNHYSMLSTLQSLFGLPCLQYACDTARVQPLLPLFAVTGAPAIATTAITPPDYPTPTPKAPLEPVSTTTDTPSSGGWTVQAGQLLGRSDNSLGGIAASSPTDVWAVGDYLPDAPGANADVTLTLAEHWNGKSWTVVPTPNAGPNFNSFYGAAASQGQAWAVGERLNDAYEDRALVESWNGSTWTIDDVPQPGAERDMFYDASATSPSDVWAVGTQQATNGGFETLVEHFDGTSWSVVPAPDPGSNGNLLYGVVAVSPDDAWAVGQQLGASSPDQALVEHWDGTAWSVVPTPVETAGTTILDAVTAQGPDLWAVGDVDSAAGGGRPLVEYYDGTSWSVLPLAPTVGSDWTDLYGVAASPSGAWAVGTFVDPETDNNDPLVLHQARAGAPWSVVNGPVPGTGSNILGGIAAVGSHLWADGIYDNGGNERPFIETTP